MAAVPGLPRGAVLAAVAALCRGSCVYTTLGGPPPPSRICGQTVWNAAAGAIVQDVADGGTVRSESAGGPLFLRVSGGCDTGVTVACRPPGAAEVVTEAKTRDGRTAGLVLRPLRTDFTLLLDRGRGHRAVVRVRLSGLPRTVPVTPPPGSAAPPAPGGARSRPAADPAS